MDDILLMEEMSEYSVKPKSKKNAVELRNLTVAWDVIEVRNTWLFIISAVTYFHRNIM